MKNSVRTSMIAAILLMVELFSVCKNVQRGISKYRAPKSFRLWFRRWPWREITKSPRWCSVGLRDGNQALPNTMNPEQKLEYFLMLCAMGFKEIEVAFPSSSQDDFNFVRMLIEGNYIPDDVIITVLTQCRPELIDRTMASIKGAKRAVVHIYIATSELHMRHVFKMTEEEAIKVAVQATRQVRQAAAQMSETDINLQFSPEEFTDTDPNFALRICEAVYDEWGQSTVEKPMILNLPATVERRPPNQVADMFEYFMRMFPHRDKVVISIHPHNDQGMAVASVELCLLAGADRVEGALFANGERTGNVPIEVVALNLLFRGIDVGLDFSKLPSIVETVERLTGIPVAQRHPYAGRLANTAFSGGHQDAIAKTMALLTETAKEFGYEWMVAYLHFDPKDVGRTYERMIRVNAQSGKGGIAWVLAQDHGIQLPRAFQPFVGAAMQARIDQACNGEVSSDQLLAWFNAEFIDQPDGPYQLEGYWVREEEARTDVTHGKVKICINGETHEVEAEGNGPIDAFSRALHSLGLNGFKVTHEFAEGSLGQDQSATGIAFMPLIFEDDETVWWGVGTHNKTHVAAAFGIVAALNRRARDTQ